MFKKLAVFFLWFGSSFCRFSGDFVDFGGAYHSRPSCLFVLTFPRVFEQAFPEQQNTPFSQGFW